MISNETLWKISKRIVELQKKASELTEEERKKIIWEMLEEDWFDYLKEELEK